MKVVAAGYEMEWPAGWRLPNKGETLVMQGQRYIIIGVEFHPRHTPATAGGGWGTPSPVNESLVVLDTEIPAEWEPQHSVRTGAEVPL